MKKFTFLFALLCVSMMSWAAIDWNAVEFLGSTEPSISMNTYKYAVDTEAGEQGPNTIANIQDADGRLGFYSTYGQGISSCSHEGKILGDQLWLYVDQLTAKDTKITVTLADASVRTFHMWYIGGTDGEGGEGGGEEPDPEPEPGVTGICNATYASNQDGYAVKATVTKGCNRYYLTLTSAVEGKVLTGLSGANMHCTPYSNAASTQALPNYHMAAAGRYTIEDGTITFCIPSIGAPKMYTPLYLQFDNVGTEHTINGLQNIPLEVCSTEPAAICPDPEPTEILDINFALLSNGALATSNATSGMPHLAINGNEVDAWDTNHGVDAIDWTVDLGQRRIFNTVNIFWNNAWGKSFDIQVSNNEEDWITVKEIRDQTTSGGAMQVISFDKTTARYVRFHGISRGTGYGYGFYEFQVLLPGVSTLTTIDLSAAATIAKVGGEGIVLTTTAKDQNGVAMDGVEITYEVSPTGAGSVVEGKYIPAQYGWATIEAKSGEVVSNSIQVFGVNSDNLALSTNIDTDNKIIEQSEITGDANNAFYAVDGNKGNVWQACRNLEDNKSNVEFTSYFTLDLGNTYAINLIAIWFDGAASDDYKIEFSADNITWKEGFRIQQSIGNYLHQKYLTNSELNNNDQARYLRFTTYKASTQNGWGLMIFEFEVYGTEASTTKNVSASVSDENRGTAVVKKGDEVVSMVEAGTDVTFIAEAKEGYEFVNWTQGSTVVSTEANYTTTITANTALVANFDYERITYCHTPVLTTGGYKVYLTIGKGVTEGTYQVTIEGSDELIITGINNANTAMNNVKFGAQDGNDVSFTKENNGWTFSNTGYGVITSAEIQPRTGYTWKDMWMWRPDLYIGTNQGEQNINGILNKYFNWDNDCADTESPVFSTLNANVINETTIQLVMKATDNWEGLLTYTIARESAEPIIIKGASGEELTQEITGLTKGTKYTFTVSVTDGVNPATSQNIEVTPVGDEEKPVMVSATLESKTWNNAVIAVVATDNKAVVEYHLVDATNSINAELEAEGGKITITGLTPSTTYNFTITAIDAAGNESETSANVEVTTDSYSATPLTAAPDPTWPADQVKSLYSNTYPFAPASLNSYNEGWWAPPTMTEGAVEGNNYLLYDLYQAGMIGVQFAETSVITMEYIHIDVWASKDGSITFRPITVGGPQEPRKTLNVKGQQWNSFDIPMSEFGEQDWTKLFQYTFENYQAGGLVGEYIAVDNVFFYRTTALEDTEKPANVTATAVSSTYFSALIAVSATDNMGVVNYTIKDGDKVLATGAGASGATINITVPGLLPNTEYTLAVIASDDKNNAADAVNVTVKTLAAPAAAPAPELTGKTVVPVYTDAVEGGPFINIGGWGQSTVVTNGQLAEGDNVMFLTNMNYLGWELNPAVNATDMEYLHVDFYSPDMTGVSITPISPGHEGVYNVTLIPNTWTSVDIPLSAYAANNIEWNNIFQFKFFDAAPAGKSLFVDNVYFYKAPEAVNFADDATDNSSIIATNADQMVNVKINRSISANGEWFTVCFPFDMDAAKVNEVFGISTIAELKSSEDYGSIIHLNFDFVNAIEAGKAYLIRPGKDLVAGTMINGVTIKNVDPTVLKSTSTHMHFQGTFNKITLTDANQRFVGSNNYVYSPAEGGTVMGAFRCYFTIPASAQALVGSKAARIVMGQNVTTDIENIQMGESQMTKVIENGALYIIRDGRKYNAQGMLVK